MSRFVRLAASVLTTAALAAPALGGAPSPGPSTTPTSILLVGRDFLSGTPSPAGTFCVVARDALGAPCPAALVEIVLQGCPDLSICGTAHDPTVSIDCATRTARKLAGSDGSACFTLEGGARPGACSPAGCAEIRADGVAIGWASVAALDLDSAGNISPSDGGRWLDDYFGPLCPRIDLDGSGTITAADFSFWQEYYFESFLQGCAPESGGRCP